MILKKEQPNDLVIGYWKFLIACMKLHGMTNED
jgi:hypothetical protein